MRHMKIHVDAHVTVNVYTATPEQWSILMADLARLTASVTSIGSATESAVTLLAELSTLIRESASDPAALEALAMDLDVHGQELADAVVANTPAAEPPVEEPPVDEPPVDPPVE